MKSFFLNCQSYLLNINIDYNPAKRVAEGSVNRKEAGSDMLGSMFRSGMVVFIIMLMWRELAVEVEAQARKLAADEVKALHEIARELGKRDWDFTKDPCSTHSGWIHTETDPMNLYNSTLICNCSFPGDVCHVDSIFLKGQDLPSVLPPSLVKLPYIRQVDFSRNYLSGTIPPAWTSTKLEVLSASINRLSGPIPKYLGNITTLRVLSLESNMFFGPIPPRLGNLVNLEKLISDMTNSEKMKSWSNGGTEFSYVDTDLIFFVGDYSVLNANYLTGELPQALTQLTKLTELIGSNNFIGRIPNIYGNWTQLQKLQISASGFEGPIPPSISSLTNLTELRISDLNGGVSQFPFLRNMKDLERLMLRSCNIYGEVPAFLSDLPKLRIIDLSFNRLVGISRRFTSTHLEKM
ncbi:hypothetical protein ES288_A06G158300v1 [Gossypium darwinii]|uniref:Leucine-rich repeat-containing N-terminal plant-type domain-containing protein n=1 Tax=Gossypium darwinii TaxID=34276 RepID=A0A5D2G6J5_GOSDA|nr:hypothetical protein ES288_A06G158300v1 [Gossypium darwinii]